MANLELAKPSNIDATQHLEQEASIFWTSLLFNSNWIHMTFLKGQIEKTNLDKHLLKCFPRSTICCSITRYILSQGLMPMNDFQPTALPFSPQRISHPSVTAPASQHWKIPPLPTAAQVYSLKQCKLRAMPTQHIVPLPQIPHSHADVDSNYYWMIETANCILGSVKRIILLSPTTHQQRK